MSSRAEHYRRAENILAPVDKRQAEGSGVGPDGPSRIALAQVHATLAAAPADVAGEYVERRVLGPGQVTPLPGPEDPTGRWIHSARLKAALEELEELGDSPQPVSQTLRSIRRWILGTEGGR